MPSAMILTGMEPYRDLWHGLGATSERVSELLRGWGFDTELTDDLLAGVDAAPDLLVVNIAGRGSHPDPREARTARGLNRILDERVPVLALHSAAIAFADQPVWRQIIGGRWEPGISGHPQIGTSAIHVLRGHEITHELDPFAVYDERYSRLTRDSGVALAEHVEDGVRHELAWALEADDGRRAVYDGLGHAVESYDSPGRVELFRREVAWLSRIRIRS
ncbi:ThuA domain-containing protein [Microbacterium oleivorans]|uniref:ThuA domain-containing protein n=1 Tax=Microbacterium oleivorans TaxID=273677 RepID=A0A7D5EXI8_9MICO|nr:ThuA domain-containing protein [Microbacterium oleivorans]QLD11208.1 ThuA domain-containing protein [Microbacterium oleivorans]